MFWVFVGYLMVLWWQIRGALWLCVLGLRCFWVECFGVGALYMVSYLIQGCAVWCGIVCGEGFCVVGWPCGLVVVVCRVCWYCYFGGCLEIVWVVVWRW